MSIFSSGTLVTIPIPASVDPSPGEHTVTIQKLSGRKLGRSQKLFFNDLIAEVQTRGGAKVQKDIQTLFEKTPEEKAAADAEVAKVQADPLNGFDKYSLLYDGIAAWTYPESLQRVPTIEVVNDRPVTVMRIPAIDDLDDAAVDFFATEIMRITKPSLFLTPEEAKTEQKNV
jgi:hypothetical protein